MIGELIAAILGLIKKGDLEQAEKMMERGYMEMLRRDAAFFQIIPKEKLTDTPDYRTSLCTWPFSCSLRIIFCRGNAERSPAETAIQPGML